MLREAVPQKTSRSTAADYAPRGTVLFIGRFHRRRWIKGGILESCHRLADELENLGMTVNRLDVDSPLVDLRVAMLRAKETVLIYAGSWNSQDALSLRMCLSVARHVEAFVYFNAVWENSKLSRERLISVHANAPENVGFFVFSDSAKRTVQELTGRAVLALPKPMRRVRRGSSWVINAGSKIFLGDVSKFLNPEITPHAREYFEALTSLVAKEKLVFVQQYMGPAVPEWLDGSEFRPFNPDLKQLFQGIRFYVHLNKHATFEMLPFEAFGLGFPLISVPMPQSLDEVLPNDLRLTVNSAEELREIASELLLRNTTRERVMTQFRTYEKSRKNFACAVASNLVGQIKRHPRAVRENET